MEIFSLADWLALGWFLLCWGGYTYFANRYRKEAVNLSQSLTEIRGSWMEAMVKREMRIADATVLGILQRTVTFFASTTIFILAGLLAVLGASDKAMQLAHALPFVAEHSQAAWELKILLMVFIFIYAFFKFSWSVRQYNFALVMFGAAPEREEESFEDYVQCSNALLTSANNSFNYGLRAYSLSMATIGWFVHPFLFMFSTAWVVAILYRREFHSRTLAAMQSAINSFKQRDNKVNASDVDEVH
ncbi:DUF599 domain-containing protein [Aliikangiella coralliicola]|uniref:DUF599 family protein n=1 Tax=Aliikangiella coralliicola TaxID=2592383 RepID=A0A545UDI9_9GAMM|nr:DUF599 domain-containing protein [Aliikangiella coralliicola]TQV87493.1 DUF599 family protein [Aliikangiella coralliicola]